MSRFVITGVPGGNAAPRLEINDFVKNEKFFSLFIQALQGMSAENENDIQSFDGVAGIHGLPYKAWDGAVGDIPFDPNSNQFGGYCTHGSVLFPTWHRPYVMLHEQILQKRAVAIAATYTVNTAAWKQAANDLRHPYWDWASNAVPPDEVIQLKQVTITNKNGAHVKVANPLYHYKFHPIDPSFPSPYSDWQTTLRQPDSTDSDTTDDVDTLRSVMASAQNDITSSTYNMLTRVTTWPAFSNHTVGDGGSTSNSLEAIHDGIHVDVGGQGHMSNPSVAAFDPIFFLHHANVDRMLSLWSALNPGIWLTPGETEDGGSFTSPPGTAVDQNSALTPFWNSETGFWPSVAVTDITKLGYTYPEFNGLDTGNPDATRTAIGNLVNQLYGASTFGSSFAAAPPSTVAPISNFAKKVPAASPSHNNPAVPHQRAADTTGKAPAAASPSHNPAAPHQQQQHSLSTHATGHLPHINFHLHRSHHQTADGQSSSGQDFWEWTARVEFKKYELGMSFSVLFFLGPVPTNPRQLRTSPNYVGGHHAFVNGSAGSCANCTNQRDVVVEGFVHLNHAIAKHSGLQSLNPNVVEPYLTENLNWVVQKANGEVVHLESLEIIVYGTELTHPPTSMFPVPGPPTRYNGITHGRRGGSRQA